MSRKKTILDYNEDSSSDSEIDFGVTLEVF
jgi:hypothetical protein